MLVTGLNTFITLVYERHNIYMANGQTWMPYVRFHMVFQYICDIAMGWRVDLFDESFIQGYFTFRNTMFTH